MKKGILWSLVCAVLLAGTAGAPAALAGDMELVNGIDANFPPFSYVDKNGNPDGFDVQAVNWIAKEMGFKVSHKPIDWDAIIPSLRAKKIDMIASGMSITEKRKEQVNFTIPYWTITQVLVVPEGSDLTVDRILSDGNKVGVQRGTSEAKWIQENLIKKEGRDFELVMYDSAPLSVEDVVNGRIVAAAMDDAPAADAAKKKPVKIVGRFGMPDEEFGYAVRKEDKELLDTLNEGLRRLMASPYWEELKQKYEL
jgi:polar amino acid transport system substrate-binding protein